MDKFTYFHCYANDLWAGYEKNGLIRDSFGIRFPESIDLPEELKFNELARVGGELYNYIKKHKCAMYVDRLQGGCFLENYPYDQELIAEYKEMLGDKFLGFQMHEWLSNYKSDVEGKLGELGADEWTRENIETLIYKKFPYSNLFIEAMTLDEFVESGKPLTAQQFYDNMTSIYKKRAEKYKLIPCDSYCLMYPFEAENGATLIMPEVGAQTTDMRIQMCYARGVCNAYGITLGAYYEPWGGSLFTCPSYQTDAKNEWYITGLDSFPFTPGGPNGGSSRSLQWRVHLYAYLSGAKMISEEWGGYNTFKDRESYELSEYGLVKKRFLDFVDKYSNVGEKLAPIACVLPNDLLAYTLWEDKDKLFGYALEGDEIDADRKRRAAIEQIFINSVDMLGSETRTLINSEIPDAVDMLNEGDGKALEKYSYLVDLTEDADFSKRHANCIAPEEVKSVLDTLLPCKVSGGLHYLVNKRGDDGYYLSVFNHSGVVRSCADGESVLPDATRTVEIELKDGRALKRLEGSEDIGFKDGKYFVTVGGGDWFFAEF